VLVESNDLFKSRRQMERDALLDRDEGLCPSFRFVCTSRRDSICIMYSRQDCLLKMCLLLINLVIIMWLVIAHFDYA